MDWLITILYGFFSALGQILPVSAAAHDYFLRLMTRFDTNQPLLMLHIHLAILAAIFLVYRSRIAHTYREVKTRKNRRQSDNEAALDWEVVKSMLVPAALGLLLTGWAQNRFDGLPGVVLLLLVSGTVLYIPHFLPMGNRDSNHLSRLEAIWFGLCAGFSALPGLSRTGGILSAGALRGCSRSYLLDMAMLVLVPLMLLQILLDLFALLAGGLAVLTMAYWIKCLLAGLAAFGGAALGLGAMRFLSVNRGFTMFAYYNWGLGIFGFILYLMV